MCFSENVEGAKLVDSSILLLDKRDDDYDISNKLLEEKLGEEIKEVVSING